MDNPIILQLLYNAELLILLNVLMQLYTFLERKHRLITKVLMGVVFGLVGVLLMVFPMQFSPGIIFDSRSILLSLVGYFVGFIPVLIASIITISYRFYLGGSGALMGILVIICSAAVGYAWRWIKVEPAHHRGWIYFYLLGLVVHIGEIFCMFALPSDIIWSTIINIGLPVLVVYPVVTMIIARLMMVPIIIIEQKDAIHQSENKFRKIFEEAPIGIGYVDFQGKFIEFNQKYHQMLGYDAEEFAKLTYQAITFSEDLAEEEKLIMQLRQGEIINFSIDKRYIKKDGSYLWAHLTASVIELSPNIPPMIMGIVADISQRKQDEILLIEKEARISAITESAQDGIVVIDNEGNIVFWNPSAYRIFGFTNEEAIGKNLHQLIVPEKYHAQHKMGFEKFKLTGLGSAVGKTLDFVAMTKSNQQIRVQLSMSALLINQQWHAVGIIRDVTQQQEIVRQLEVSEEKFRTLYRTMDQGMVIINIADDDLMNAIIVDCNYAFEQIVELPHQRIVNLYLHQVEKSIADLLIPIFNNVLENHQPVYSEIYVNYLNKTLAMHTYEPKDKQLAVIIRDISEQKKAQGEIIYLSYHDYLTGLYNRRFFEEELKRLDTQRNLPFTVVFGDVNGLKLINDSFGHEMGDKLLIKVAEILKATFRADDIIARLGGDEFVVILPKTSKQEAHLIIERVRVQLKKETIGNLELSVAFGYDVKTDVQQSIQSLLRNAENNMYQNKLYDGQSTRHNTIELIMKALFEKNQRELFHSNRVSEYCGLLAKALSMNNEDIQRLKLTGLMHDIGKIGIDEEILNSNQKLTAAEWQEIFKHPDIGHRILSSSNDFVGIAQDVLQHHERWDGQGYPKGLIGEEISLNARIIAIADTFDALTSDRAYRKAFNVEDAIKEMKQCSGTQFDPDLLDVFIKLITMQQ